MSSTEPPEVWLEDLDVEHLRDVYKMFLDPTMELLSPTCDDRSIEACRDELQQWLAGRAGKSWHMAKVIMANFREPGRSGSEAVGAIYTNQPTFYGLGIRFEVRRGCEGRGFATQGLRRFADEYWEGPRRAAPVREALLEPRFFASREMRGSWERARDEVRGLDHLIAATDRQDGHAQRVLEKLGLEPEEEEEMIPCYFYRLKRPAE